MITLDTSGLTLIIVAAGLAGALIAALPPWRRLNRAGPHLPVRAFLRRHEATLERVAALQAELRCELCDAKEQCRQLLRAGAIAPAAGCPNEALFTVACGTPVAPKA